MNISQEGINITKRFFEAIETLKNNGIIRGLQTFTTRYNLNRWNVNTVKWNPESSVLKPEWIHYLCRDYNVSPAWVILGKGGMFGENKYNFIINEWQLKVGLNTIESFLDRISTITYIPGKNNKTVIGTVNKIMFDNKNKRPVVEVVTEDDKSKRIDIYSITSIE